MSLEDIQALISRAEEAMQSSIAPYSGFKVGAALLAENGETITGCNIENRSLMLTICAERVALFKALSDGHRGFSAMAVVGSDESDCFPCGSCRQLLWEFAPELHIYLVSARGVKKYSIGELLPHPFEREI